MKKINFSTDFTQGNIPRQLVNFALPLYLSNILQIVYNIVDMMIVGQVMGKIGLSAVAIGGDVSHFLNFFAMGFSGAGQVIIAQLWGAKNSDELGRFIGNMVTFLFCGGIFLSAVSLIFLEDILEIMSTPPESFSEAFNYATVTMSGVVFMYGYNAISSIMRGLGDSKHPFIFIGVAAILNVILDVIFVIFLEFGARGAALATVISQGASFLICVIFMYNRRRELAFKISLRDFFTPDKKLLTRLLKLGFPMAIRSASISTSKLFVSSWVNSYGVVVSAFAGVANKISSVSMLLSNALTMAGSSMIGQNIGAKKFERVTKILKVMFQISLTIAAILSVSIYIFPEEIYSAFTDDEKVLQVGMEFLPLAVLLFFGSACRSPMSALINGSGNYLANFLTAIFDGIILRIGLALMFGLTFEMKYLGFWLGDAIAGFTPLVIGMTLYFSGKWQK